MFDVMQDLRERFDYAAYFYLSAWERDPDMRIEGNTIIRGQQTEAFEDQMSDTFEALRDTVGVVPAELLKDVGKLRNAVGAERYEQLVIASIQSIKPPTLPVSGTEFVLGFRQLLEAEVLNSPAPTAQAPVAARISATAPPTYGYPGER